ncbi:hypothetical protein TeGR_g8634, partial [Tetraparma gracilis]
MDHSGPPPPGAQHEMSTSARGFVEWICRGYSKKSSALFDLLDNSDDATTKASKLPSSKWIHCKDRVGSNPTPALVITNGCDGPRPISHCLEFACSDKKDTDQIGENGVGLKQSIIYLSSSGLVVSRNGPVFGVALVSKALNLSDKHEGGSPT